MEKMKDHRIKAAYVVEEWTHHVFHHMKPPSKATDFFMRTPPGSSTWVKHLGPALGALPHFISSRVGQHPSSGVGVLTRDSAQGDGGERDRCGAGS